VHALLSVSKTHVRVFFFSFLVHFVAERYILQLQKCLKGQIGTCPLGTRWYNFTPVHRVDPESHNALRYRQADRRTGGRHGDANSWSHCVAVRSAKTRPINRFQICECSSLITALNIKLNQYAVRQQCSGYNAVIEFYNEFKCNDRIYATTNFTHTNCSSYSVVKPVPCCRAKVNASRKAS